MIRTQTLEKIGSETTTEVIILEEKPVLRVHLPDLYLKAKRLLKQWFEVVYEEAGSVSPEDKVN